jgi:serine/threonine protein kinase
MGIILKHATEPLPRPRVVNPNLPDPIEAVLIKALAKDPQERYPDVMSMSHAFEAALAEVYDPESGKLKPGSVGAPPVEEVAGSNGNEGNGGGVEDDSEPSPRKPSWVILILLLSLMALWGVWRLAFGLRGRDQGPSENFPATVQALYTSVAQGIGADMPIDQVQTAVAGTLQVMGVTTPTSVGDAPPQIDYGVLGTSTTPTLEEPESATQTAIFAADTGTSTPSRTPTKAATDSASPTSGPTQTASSTITATWTVTPTYTFTPTRTSVPPSNTSPPPTQTSSPVPSQTPTPTQDVCELITLGSFAKPSEARWTISNGTGSTIRLTRIRLTDWPSSNGSLYTVLLDGVGIWSQEVSAPPADISSGWIGSPSARDIDSSAQISFFFGFSAANSPYDLRLTFANGCVVRDQR